MVDLRRPISVQHVVEVLKAAAAEMSMCVHNMIEDDLNEVRQWTKEIVLHLLTLSQDEGARRDVDELMHLFLYLLLIYSKLPVRKADEDAEISPTSENNKDHIFAAMKAIHEVSYYSLIA